MQTKNLVEEMDSISEKATFDTNTSEEVFSGSTVSWFTSDSPAIYLTPLWKSDYVLALSYCTILGVALLIGTFGNVIIIVVTSSTSAMNKVGKQFVINLALSDLCVSGIAEPMCIVAVIMGEEWFSDKWLLCELTAAMCTTACFCSFLSLTAVTINRYMYICHHKIYDKIFTSISTIMVCLGCWVIAFGFEFPNLIGWGDHAFDKKNHQCHWDRTADLSYTLFLSIFLVGGPLSLMTVCYILIFRKIWKTKANIYDRDKDGSQGKDIVWKQTFRASRTLLVMFIVYIVCWVPYAVITGSDVRDEYATEAHLFATMLAHFHSSSPIIVYMFTNKKFRETVLKAFPCTYLLRWTRSFTMRSDDLSPSTTGAIKSVSTISTGVDGNSKVSIENAVNVEV